MIVLTPKSLLRHPLCASDLHDLAHGSFQRVIPDSRPADAETKRIILCSGKVYYDLIEERDRIGCKNVAIVRIEQFYPLSPSILMKALENYADATDLVWFQDEPTNMGGWYFIKMRFGDIIGKRFPIRLISRVESASPSTGSASAHKLEQRELLDQAFAGL